MNVAARFLNFAPSRALSEVTRSTEGRANAEAEAGGDGGGAIPSLNLTKQTDQGSPTTPQRYAQP